VLTLFPQLGQREGYEDEAGREQWRILIWLKMRRQTVHLRAPLPDQIPWKHR